MTKTLHLRGRDIPPYLHGRMLNGDRHAGIKTKLVGEHFDEVVIHYTEGFDPDELHDWCVMFGMTRLLPGGTIAVIQGPVFERWLTAPAVPTCECGSGSNTPSGAHSHWCRLWVAL